MSPGLIEAARELAGKVLAEHAFDVDRAARFPAEAVAGMRAAGLLAAGAPRELGGGGAGVATLAAIARELAAGCGSSALIWAMHQVQLGCLCRYSQDSAVARARLAAAVQDQWLIASATSEAGTGGDLGRSEVAVEPAEDGSGRLRVDKAATTLSYGQEADAILLTARREPTAAPVDQVAVLLDRSQFELSEPGEWQPLGMRGTRSGSCRIRADFERDQLLDAPFQVVAAGFMTPLSHVLWSAVWIGLADEALRRARQSLRQRRAGGADGPAQRLAEARWRLASVEQLLAESIDLTERLLADGAAPTVGYTTKLNLLKVAVSETALEVAGRSLRICGMAGYSELGPLSVSRILRDLHSAPLMVGNDRLLAITGELALLAR
jgi:acyl-CoA dehydrogenase